MESPNMALPLTRIFCIACGVYSGKATCSAALLACLALVAGCSGSNNTGIALNQPQASTPETL